MSENLHLGQIITTPQQRDAIHIAVLPVLNGGDETLLPGQHIGFSENGWWVTGNPKLPRELVGIVDPFLAAPVKPREQFWMFLYPQTITGLRHDWSHPSIAQDGCSVGSSSEKWLRDFAASVDADYYEMMHVASTHCEGAKNTWPDYLTEDGKWEGQSTPVEFWTHFKNVTGKRPPGDETPGIFSCLC